jgi:hypothetical protein
MVMSCTVYGSCIYILDWHVSGISHQTKGFGASPLGLSFLVPAHFQRPSPYPSLRGSRVFTPPHKKHLTSSIDLRAHEFGFRGILAEERGLFEVVCVGPYNVMADPSKFSGHPWRARKSSD